MTIAEYRPPPDLSDAELCEESQQVHAAAADAVCQAAACDIKHRAEWTMPRLIGSSCGFSACTAQMAVVLRAEPRVAQRLVEVRGELLDAIDELRVDVEQGRAWPIQVEVVHDLVSAQRALAADPGAGGHRWYESHTGSSCCAVCPMTALDGVLKYVADALPECGTLDRCPGDPRGQHFVAEGGHLSGGGRPAVWGGVACLRCDARWTVPALRGDPRALRTGEPFTRHWDIEVSRAAADQLHREILAPHRVRLSEPATRVQDLDLAHDQALAEQVVRAASGGDR